MRLPRGPGVAATSSGKVELPGVGSGATAGLGPAIHDEMILVVLFPPRDARPKAGHDGRLSDAARYAWFSLLALQRRGPICQIGRGIVRALQEFHQRRVGIARFAHGVIGRINSPSP